MQNLRYALRNLWRRPGFTVVAALTLALGLGANTAIFSVVHAVLLQPLPFVEPERLVRVHQLPVSQSETVLDVMYLDWVDWRRETRAFDDLAAFASSSGGFVVEVDDAVETVEGKLVTWNLLSMLGVSPLHGRNFIAEDDRVGAEQVVLISEGFWRQRFGADPAVVGQTFRIGGDSHRVIGVLPTGVEYPVGAKMWLPVVPSVDPSFSETRGVGFLNLVGRLAPGTSAEQASADLSAVIERVTNALLPESAATRAVLLPFEETLLGETRAPLLILLAAAGLVLLIACANIANLQIVRGMGRRREIAIRGALGARWVNLARLSLLESSLLAMIGGAVGLLLARWGVGTVMAWSPVTLFRGETVAIEGRVLMVSLILMLVTAFVFGLAPFLQRRQEQLAPALKQGDGRGTAGGTSRRWLSIFAVSQVTLALVVLIGAGLLIRSLNRLQELEVGFDRDNVLTVAVALLDERYTRPEVAHQLFEALVSEVRTLPGVAGAAGSLRRPLESPLGFDYSFTLEGRPEDEQPNYPRLNYVAVTPGYFATLGVPLLEGRAFATSDRDEATPVAIVSASTARRFWGKENPVGKRLKWGTPESIHPWIEIVGVAGEIRSRTIEAVSLDVYVPYRQNSWPLRNLMVRSEGDPLALAAAVRRELRRLDPAVRASEIATTGDLINRSMARPRFQTLLLGLFGFLAVAIGAVGIYGVLSYSVALRRREIGVRLALGATPADVLKLALLGGLRLAVAGVVLGLVIASGLSRGLTSLLFEISTTDLGTYAGVSFLLLAVCLLACAVPAWRASRVDPLRVLRD